MTQTSLSRPVHLARGKPRSTGQPFKTTAPRRSVGCFFTILIARKWPRTVVVPEVKRSVSLPPSTCGSYILLTYAHRSRWSIDHLRPLAIALCSGLLWPFHTTWSLAVSALIQCLASNCCQAGLFLFRSPPRWPSG